MSEANKKVVLDWFHAMKSRDTEAVTALTHPDFRYFLPGGFPVSGWHDFNGFTGQFDLLADVMAGPLEVEYGDIVAEGERVFIEAQGDGPLKNGQRYQNVYILAIRVRDGKVAEFKEFMDTLHAYQMLDHPKIRGPAKARERHLSQVAFTLSS
jgi:ketosteroid isomerase-like protein